VLRIAGHGNYTRKKILEKLIYKEQTIVDELRKRTKNKERRTKNKVFTVERTRSRKCLSWLLPSPVFYL